MAACAMSQQASTAAPRKRSSIGCDICIYGRVSWLLVYQWADCLEEREHELCDRCADSIAEACREGYGQVYEAIEAC